MPTINKFISNLDKEKRDRDKEIDRINKERKKQAKAGQDGDVQPHQETTHIKSNQKEVTDPVTGKQVVIEDVNKDMIKHVTDPVVRCYTICFQRLDFDSVHLAICAKCKPWQRHSKYQQESSHSGLGH